MAVDIEDLYRRYGPMVLRRCRRLLRDEAQAVDVMHDVFVEMLRRKGDLTNEAPASLLLVTATNLSLNRLRGRRRHPESSDDVLLQQIADFEPPGAAEDRSLAARLLDRIFGGEPASTRLIATLVYVDRMTLPEVAAEVGLSVSGVRKRLRVLKGRLPVDRLPAEEM